MKSVGICRMHLSYRGNIEKHTLLLYEKMSLNNRAGEEQMMITPILYLL